MDRAALRPTTFQRSWVVLASGVALAGSFEPLAVPYLAPLAVAILGLCLSGRSLMAGAWLGWVFGVGFMATLIRWLGPSIGYDAWLALSLIEAGWFGLTALGFRLVSRLPVWPAWAAAVWTSVEVLRGQWPFGGFPWGRLGFSVVDSPWAAVLPYAGTTGTTFLVALMGSTSVWVVLAVPHVSLRRLAVLGTLVGASMLPALVPFVPQPSGSSVVAVVQGDVPGAGNEVAANGYQVTRNHVAATRQLAAEIDAGQQRRPDLVVWPENSTAVDPFTDPEVGAGIAAATEALGGIPVLLGALVDGPTSRTLLNQGIVWTSDGPTSTRYTKRHPVPFGEYIPYRSVLGAVTGRLEQVPRDMLPGNDSAPLMVGGIALADAICFDIAYDDVVGPQVNSGAELVVVQTSNASFIGTDQLDQQFAITRARALETGRTVVVASLNGISAVIGPGGEVESRAALRRTEVIMADVALSRHLTPAVRLGSMPSNLVVAATLVALIAAIVGPVSRRRRGAGTSATSTFGQS